MTAAEFKNRFLLICDKVGSPYFSDAEIEDFINTAQLQVIDELLFPKRRNQDYKEKDAFEFSSQNSLVQGLEKLHSVDISAISDVDLLTFSDFEFNTSKSIYKIINLFLPEDELVATPQYSARYVKSLESAKGIYSNLRFGNPSVKTAIYTILSNSIVWTPALQVAGEVKVEFIRKPVAFKISAPAVTCEVSDIYHNRILLRALNLAGISIREDFLYETTNIEEQKGLNK